RSMCAAPSRSRAPGRGVGPGDGRHPCCPRLQRLTHGSRPAPGPSIGGVETSGSIRLRRTDYERRRRMIIDPVLLQQVINGLSLGAMYALLALGFTLVYGILELINFAHFNVFMVSSFIGMWALEMLGLSGQSTVLGCIGLVV